MRGWQDLLWNFDRTLNTIFYKNKILYFNIDFFLKIKYNIIAGRNTLFTSDAGHEGKPPFGGFFL